MPSSSSPPAVETLPDPTPVLLLRQEQLRNLRAKLAKGDELTSADLLPLRLLLHSDDDGDTTGGVPYLDRSLLDGGQVPSADGGGSGGGPLLVRYVGMVQDMLDPEYYPSRVKGRSAHFRDWTPLSSEEEEDGGDDDADGVSSPTGPLALAERVPLFVVPIPFASQWLVEGLARHRGASGTEEAEAEATPRGGGSPTSVVAAVVPPTPQQEGRKRGREGQDLDPHDGGGPERAGSGAPRRRTPPSAASPMEVDDDDGGEEEETDVTVPAANGCYGEDWWPPGTCGTLAGDCPVLAKLCYDELHRLHDGATVCGNSTASGSGRRLRLNDLVSMVGVLSVNPWEADFPGQRRPAGSGGAIESDDGFGGGCCFEVDATAASFAPRSPPPSRLPRLHVLSYRVLDLDELASSSSSFRTTSGPSQGQGIQTDPMGGRATSVVDDDDVDVDPDDPVANAAAPPLGVPSAMMAPELMGGCDPLVTQALWMCLLSKAERRRGRGSQFDDPDAFADATSPPMIRAGPTERALGCLSLQISTPDLSTGRSCFEHLAANVLPALCPVVAAVEVVGGTPNRAGGGGGVKFSGFAVAPRQDEEGRLGPCPLQLPAGSVLLVLYHPAVSGGAAPASAVNDDDGFGRDANVLAELVQHHRLPYTFGGGVVLPFEADYRVIVVTTQTQRLPTTLTVFARGTSWPAPGGTGSGNRQDATTTTTTTSSASAVARLRRALSVARTRGHAYHHGHGGGGIKLTPSLLERAQQDFLERRQQRSNADDDAVGGDSATMGGSPPPGEDDFHRWLNLTKLQAKSRRTNGEFPLFDSNDMDNEEDWEATVDDWLAALQFDDIIRGME